MAKIIRIDKPEIKLRPTNEKAWKIKHEDYPAQNKYLRRRHPWCIMGSFRRQVA
jgi:hypothetical protein